MRRLFLFSPWGFVATTANEIGPLRSVFSSNVASFDLRLVSPQLRSLDSSSFSTVTPFIGGSTGVTDRTNGKNVMTLKFSVIWWRRQRVTGGIVGPAVKTRRTR